MLYEPQVITKTVKHVLNTKILSKWLHKSDRYNFYRFRDLFYGQRNFVCLTKYKNLFVYKTNLLQNIKLPSHSACHFSSPRVSAAAGAWSPELSSDWSIAWMTTSCYWSPTPCAARWRVEGLSGWVSAVGRLRGQLIGWAFSLWTIFQVFNFYSAKLVLIPTVHATFGYIDPNFNTFK